MMNVYLIIMEGRYGAIYDDYYTCRGYHIIVFSSYPYKLQADLIIDGQVISSGEMLFERTYLFPTNKTSRYYVLQENKSNNQIVSLRTIINGNVNAICYDLKDIVPPYVRSISRYDYNTLSPLHTPMV